MKSNSVLARWRNTWRSISVSIIGALPRPKPPRNLSRMPALQRCAEVLRYALLRLELWISPRGGLREWTRINVGFALFIGIPAIVLLPIVSFVVGQFTAWAFSLVELLKGLLQILALCWVAVAIVAALFCFHRERK